MKIFGIPIFESLESRRVIGGTTVSPTADYVYSSLSDEGSFWKFLAGVRKLMNDRASRTQAYLEMIQDSLINAAVEMYAEDATQTDGTTGKTVWIESTDAELASVLNAFLQHKVEIEKKIYTWAFAVAFRGELFLKTYHTEMLKSGIIDPHKTVITDIPPGNPSVEKRPPEKHLTTEKDAQITSSRGRITEARDLGFAVTPGTVFETVTDPSTVFDICLFDKTIGYYQQLNPSSGVLYGREDFIHIIASNGVESDEITINLNDTPRKYKFRYGASFLDGARQAANIVHLLEDILVSTRLSRSALVRLFSVNVGDADAKETLKILRELKNSMKSRESLDPTKGTYRSDLNPTPIGGHIYIPTRNGKGDVTVNEVGGTVDIHAMVDFDYFKGKLFAALKIPKAFLGFDENVPSGQGNASLTRMDIRYCRTVKRLTASLSQGVKDICNYYLAMNGMGEKRDQFTVVMTRVNDAEESDRITDIQNKGQAVDAIVGFLNNMEGSWEFLEKKNVLHKFFDMIGLDWMYMSKLQGVIEAIPDTSAEPDTVAEPDTSAEPDSEALPDSSALKDTNATPDTSAVPDTTAVPDSSAILK